MLETTSDTIVTAHFLRNHKETNSKTKIEYTVTFVEIDEASNIRHHGTLTQLKKMGKEPEPPNHVPGLASGGPPTGRVGFAPTWKAKIYEHDLWVHYRGSFQKLCEVFKEKSAAVTGGEGLTLQIGGNPTLTPLALKIVTSAGQVGITGSTYIVGKLGLRFDTIGSANETKTFRYVNTGTVKVFVCQQPWTVADVKAALEAAIAQTLPGYIVPVTVE